MIANFVFNFFTEKFSNQGSGLVSLDSQGFKPLIYYVAKKFLNLVIFDWTP